MRWLVQKNIKENKYNEFIEQLDRLGCDYRLVNVFAFVNKIFPASVHVDDMDTADEIEISPEDMNQTVVIGSVRLARLAMERGIQPGSFQNENFDFKNWSEGFGRQNILNGDSLYFTCETMKNWAPSEAMFVRPAMDNKAFTGCVMNAEQLRRFVENVGQIDPEQDKRLNKTTPITIATVKMIHAETRFFVVDGKVISGSLYKVGNQVMHLPSTDTTAAFAAECFVKEWQPAKAFVIDLAATPEGYKIVEINSFGSSGFYKCDTQKIIAAVENMMG